MRAKKFLAVFTAFALLFVSVSAAQAANSPGGTCPTIGKPTVIAKKTYVCSASGKKKIWKLKPAPVASANPVLSTTSFADCRLPVADGRGDVAIGLPRIAFRGKNIGTVNVTVIFVDFPDAKATMTPAEAFARINPRATEIFKQVSYGQLDYKMTPNLKWFTMSKKSTEYSYRSFEGQHAYFEEAIKLADSTTDFSKTDSTVVISNPDQTALENGPAVSYFPDWGIVADGNNLHNGATSGHDINNWGAIWLNHEISHSFGLVDLYSAKGNSYETQFEFTGEFSYMGLSHEDSQAPELFAWERLVMGWLKENQFYCKPNGVGTYEISPVESAGGVKAVVIPTGPTTALVVESRRALGLDSKLRKEGLVVYRVNSKNQSGFAPIQVISNYKLMEDPRYLRAPLAVGESVTVDGYTFKHTSASASTDQLVVSK